MPTIAAASHFNAEASLNASFATFVNAVTLPAWLSRPAVVYDAPDIEPSVPCYSLFHIPVSSADPYQGSRESASYRVSVETQMVEISAWASRADVNWMAQLRTMNDIVKTWRLQSRHIVLMDYATSQSAPSATSYRLELDEVIETGVEPNPNPGIERRRMMVTYKWTYRA